VSIILNNCGNETYESCAQSGQDIYNRELFDDTPVKCCDGQDATNYKGRIICPESSDNNRCVNYNERTDKDISCCDGSQLQDGICRSKCSRKTSCNMGTETDKKVIVIRHACDLDKFIYGKYNAQLPSGNTKQYNLQGLSDLGCKQAYALSVALPKFIDENKYAPITKVSVQDPHPDGETSNPFRTVFNFIQSCNIKDVDFIDTKTKTMDNVSVNTNNTSGSLLYCYTSQVLGGNIVNDPEENSVLFKLKNKFNIKSTILKPPWKAYTIYVFSEGNLEYYHLDVDNKIIIEGNGFGGKKPC